MLPKLVGRHHAAAFEVLRRSRRPEIEAARNFRVLCQLQFSYDVGIDADHPADDNVLADAADGRIPKHQVAANGEPGGHLFQ
ncbi:hypothetical protein D3C87_2109560 [compost metagenome]